MNITIKLKKSILDTTWGCAFSAAQQSYYSNKVELCYIKISDLEKISLELTKDVQDTSWMKKMDYGVQRQYRRTVSDTSKALLEIFQETRESNAIGKEFGEIMVSMGAIKALEMLFSHTKIPISELWKPQVKQNEGFDFHTICASDYINFGEAKYSSRNNPYTEGINQAFGFIEEEKHLRDRGQLSNLTDPKSIKNLDSDKFGIVISFSINSNSPETIFSNAINKNRELFLSGKVEKIYLVGVSS